ncbi:hypothetical protein AJ78_08676 [Emergomyces pasteurianus Ep9510]|uniref:Uncharacterized protein n=1 Tax=Emergomyces pasteurianus Ep9510 TaxID=1447872 RepID=A0A1J9Q4Z3_9EURO|nr:hypothetical protein AJ78_08676 [Emergomyces pasteurianus Ep9510]
MPELMIRRARHAHGEVITCTSIDDNGLRTLLANLPGHCAILLEDVEVVNSSSPEGIASLTTLLGVVDGVGGGLLQAPAAESEEVQFGDPRCIFQQQTGKPPKDHKDHDLHGRHHHAKPKTHEGKKGHSHGDLNMRGVFLHVVGDALGNIGVIASALVIWLTDYSWRYYVDPGISLVITFIILVFAIPLCKTASRILLQAVPADLSIDHIIEDIQSLPDIISCHHLHVWQLSDTKLVCSLHIQVSHDVKGEGIHGTCAPGPSVSTCVWYPLVDHSTGVLSG